MDFSFSEEQNSIRELARQILEAEATVERIKVAEESDSWCDEILWEQVAKAGLLGIAIPEAHGGMGMGFGDLCVFLEEIGRAVVPGPWLTTLAIGALPLSEFGTDDQQAKWLPAIASGEATIAGALEDLGSRELARPATTARPAGAGFVLSGGKATVSCAGSVDVLLVSATEGDRVGLFLVDIKSDGVRTVSRAISTGEPLADVFLDDVVVPAECRLGGADADGVAILAWLEPRVFAAISALQVGVCDRALKMTSEYVAQREQFGVPIGSFQAVQHRSADGFIDLEALRWTTWRAITRLSEGLPATRAAIVAKVWAADAGSRIANSGLHLHGGLGADVDYPIHRYFLWSKALELAWGGAQPTLARLGRDMAENGPSEES